MEEDDKYQKRYFGTRTGDVELTCCRRCGSIVWNPSLHERTYHGSENDQVGTGVEDIIVAGAEDDGNRLDLGTSGSGRDSAPDRPVSSPPARGTGRATAAGTGKQGRR